MGIEEDSFAADGCAIISMASPGTYRLILMDVPPFLHLLWTIGYLAVRKYQNGKAESKAIPEAL